MQIQGMAFPEALDAYLGYMRVRITEELAWLRGSPLYAIMADGGGGSAKPGDTALLEARPCLRLSLSACRNPLQPRSCMSVLSGSDARHNDSSLAHEQIQVR